MKSALFFLLLLAGTGALPAASAPHTIIFFGDSITAGYGLDDPDQAFPGLIRQKIVAAHLPYQVVNAGLSGETSAAGVRRLDWVLRQSVDVFVLELGANDMLRGLPVPQTRDNLQLIIDRVRQKSPRAKIVLAGMQGPRNLGEEYTRAFAAIYRELAEKNNLPLIPFLLEGVGGHPDLNQPDGIHPTAEGHAIVAENVWKVLQPLL